MSRYTTVYDGLTTEELETEMRDTNRLRMQKGAAVKRLLRLNGNLEPSEENGPSSVSSSTE